MKRIIILSSAAAVLAIAVASMLSAEGGSLWCSRKASNTPVDACSARFNLGALSTDGISVRVGDTALMLLVTNVEREAAKQQASRATADFR